MPGVTGREVTAAYGRTSTWGSPSSVTQQILLQSLDGFDVEPVFIDDDSFSQTWRGPSEISDTTPRSQELAMQARFEDMDVWYAAGVGASSVPIASELFGGVTSAAELGRLSSVVFGATSVAVLAANSAGVGYINATNTAARPAATPAQRTAHTNAVNTLITRNNTLIYSNSIALVSGNSVAQPLSWRHQINMAPDLSHIMTLAANVDVPKIGPSEGDSGYVLQISALKLRGWMLRIGENGVIQASFPVVGNRAEYPKADIELAPNSIVVNRSSIKGAPAARLGNRLLRKHMRFRMKGQTEAPLATADEMTTVNGPVREISFDFTRPLAEDDFAVGQDYVIEPDDDGFAELPVEITFGRMHAKTANSLYTAMLANGVYKADAQWTGPYINSTVKREMLITMPALQIVGWRAPITGQQQVRPIGMFKMRKSDVPLAEVPGFTKHDPDSPARIVLINGNHNHLSSTSNIFRVHDD